MLAHPGLISQDEEAVGGSDKGDSPLAHLGRAHGIDEREEVELAPLHGGLASLELDHLAEISSEEVIVSARGRSIARSWSRPPSQ